VEHKNFERELPEGYRLALHINAKSILLGIIMSVASLIVSFAAIVLLVAPVLRIFDEMLSANDGEAGLMLIAGIMLGVFIFIPFVVLHELIHGWAYKRKTGEKLTFGMSWSCAYCGVPNIYTYRSTALYSVLAPMVIISALTLLLTVITLAITPAFPLGSTAHKVLFCIVGALISLFSFHLGGCVGDGYVALLFAFKYRDEKALMRDTGPEQFFYVPDECE